MVINIKHDPTMQPGRVELRDSTGNILAHVDGRSLVLVVAHQPLMATATIDEDELETQELRSRLVAALSNHGYGFTPSAVAMAHKLIDDWAGE